MESVLSSDQFYAWVILPIIIFLARVCDVTLGTIRIIFTSRGKRNLAPLLGFVEVLIWIVVIGQLVQNLGSITSYLGYAAGFAVGNFVGMYIEDHLALGTLIVRTIVPGGGDELMKTLRTAGYGVTGVNGEGANGPVKLVYTIVKRRNLKDVVNLIHATHPKAFLSVEDVRSTAEGIFPPGMNDTNFLGRIIK
ncbi:MAG: DUF2179 domain-containing protein [Chloroflexi bacterium]|nr:DUF2179 domain-containing protein [Chloroflexota bacterium]